MKDEPNIGTLEGERCNRDGCDGVMEVEKPNGCSCHINPPCHVCMDAAIYCPKCGEEVPYE